MLISPLRWPALFVLASSLAFGACSSGSGAGDGGAGSGGKGGTGLGGGAGTGSGGSAGMGSGGSGGAGGAGSTLTGATAVSVNSEAASDSYAPSACAITAGGGVVCWGSNSHGELGNNSTTDSLPAGQPNLVPVQVAGLTSGVTAVSAGGNSVCAIAGGGVVCWGWVDNATTDSLVPMPVAGLTSGVTAVSVGVQSACAVTAAGAVMCWGFNGSGELGNGSTTESLVPVQVSGLISGATAVSVGEQSACAIVAGTAMCWGNYGPYGGLGNNSQAGSLVPVQVSGLTSGVTAVSVGFDSACAIVAGGVMCWGNNLEGELGNDSNSGGLVPVQVTGLTGGVTAVSVGSVYTDDSSCAITASGTVVSWGFGTEGTGGANSEFSSLATQVPGLPSGVTAVSEGGGVDQSACAITAGGGVVCWGRFSKSGYGTVVPVGGLQ
jgi:alpha-tubulin suppressor-like RCC1 family protein